MCLWTGTWGLHYVCNFVLYSEIRFEMYTNLSMLEKKITALISVQACARISELITRSISLPSIEVTRCKFDKKRFHHGTLGQMIPNLYLVTFIHGRVDRWRQINHVTYAFILTHAWLAQHWVKKYQNSPPKS